MSGGPARRVERPQQRVAQKLGFARWHLQWMDQHAASAEREALLESAILHTLGAYRAFLVEIAQDQHLQADGPRADVNSAEHLSGAYGEFLPPALAQCVNLEAQPGWLSDLLRWNARLEAGARVSRPAAAQLIAASDDDAAPTRAAVAQGLEQLEALIERLRGDMLEC